MPDHTDFPPPQTAEVFQALIQGQFISQNSQQARLRQAYQLLAAHEPAFRAYFAPLGYELQHQPGYFFVSQATTGSQLSDKLERLEKILDLLEPLLMYQPDLHPGQVIALAPWEAFVRSHRKINRRVLSLPLRTQSTQISDRLKAILRILERERFLDVIDEEAQTYVVLYAFDYLRSVVRRLATQA